MIQGYFDGACEPVNPGGTASWGFVVKEDGKTIFEGHGVVGSGDGMTNNVAEYCGIIFLLKHLKSLGLEDKEICVFGDSNMVIQQISGNWKVRDNKEKPYKKYAREALELAKQFKRVTYKWIPREQNEEADLLSKKI